MGLYWEETRIDRQHKLRNFCQYGTFDVEVFTFFFYLLEHLCEHTQNKTNSKQCVKMKTFTWEKLVKIAHFQSLPLCQHIQCVFNWLCEL